MKNKKTKQYLFPAVAGMAAFVGMMNEGFASAPAAAEKSIQMTYEKNTGTPSVSTTTVLPNNDPAYTVTPSGYSNKQLTIIVNPEEETTSVTVTAASAVARSSQKLTQRIYLQHPNTTTTKTETATVNLIVTAPRCGDIIEFFDMAIFSGTRSYTPSANAAVGSTWNDDTQNKLLNQPHTTIWYGPVEPAYSNQMGGCKLIYKNKTLDQLQELFMKKLSS